MGVIEGVLPYKCPKCNSFSPKWERIGMGSEVNTSSNKYSVGKGLAGGLLFGPAGTLAGFSHSKGSAKSKRIDTYRCRECGYTVPREVSTFY